MLPFLKAFIICSSGMERNGVDVVRDTISLPGLAKQILRKHVPYWPLYYIEDQQIYSTIRENEVGGQSIIFTRKYSQDYPYFKGFDANSLYLYCLGEGQYTGKPIVYESCEFDDLIIRRILN